MNNAERCRQNGWSQGTRLVGDEGYGPTVIELTAIGERIVLAKMISHNGAEETEPYEKVWTLQLRNWKELNHASI